MVFSIKINGKEYPVTDSAVDTRLVTFIRSNAQLTGTKTMCLEGGCGACLVSVQKPHPVTGTLRTYAVNSCLKLLYSCEGMDITTIEGIGNKTKGYHPIQERLYDFSGSQCGYCSSGMIVNMYSLVEQYDDQLSMDDIENSFGGNICRCTGYRPILDAFKSFATNADQKLLDACKKSDLTEMDIEDLTVACAKMKRKCSQSCKRILNPQLQFEFRDNRQWYKAICLRRIFEIFNQIDSKPYMLVAGNTADGVYRVSHDLKVFIDVNDVPELHTNGIKDDKLIVGGNVSLTEFMSILFEAQKNRGFQYCADLRKHIDLVANVPVRNAGTIAGNLSIKHAHNEFSSDIFLILEACGAVLTIAEAVDKETQVSVLDYLKVNMNKKVLLNVTLKKLDETYIFKSFKIMIRAQNAHAYVNCGILMQITSNIISSFQLCYGGINPTFVHATATEKMLIGKNLYTNETLQAALSSLSNELKADWVLPDGSPEYRNNLAMSLFYRFVLNTCPDTLLTKSNISGGYAIERPLSSGIQDFQTFKENWPLTKPLPKYEGRQQCSGEAKYINDLPPQKDELWAAFVTATKVHARIGKINTDAAMQIPGVTNFFLAKDIPGKNSFTPPFLTFTTVEEEIFVGIDSEVLYYGQPIGVILAETMELAYYAATKVKIMYVDAVSTTNDSMYSMARSFLNPLIGQENKDKKIIPTIRDAYAANATDRFNDSPHCKVASTYGVNATQTIKGRFEVAGQYHYTMETHTTICVPSEDGMDVHASTQWLDFTQVAISECLNVPANSINMTLKRIGGAYGSKIVRSSLVACACAIACFHTSRPVRFVLKIESNMTVLGKRYGCIGDYTVAIDDNGKIQSLVNNYSEDYGCSLNEDVEGSTTQLFPNCYVSDTWTINAKQVITDAPSNSYCRSPGTLEGIAMIENIMEHIAKAVSKDPVDVRLANMSADNPLRTLSADFLKNIDYDERKQACAKFNGTNRWHKRGISVVTMEWPLIYFGIIPSFVAIYHRDGSVVVTHGGVECGQGINTKVAQVAAWALGVPVESVSVKATNNVVSANSILTGSSCTSEMACYATKRACDILIERIKPVRDKMPNAKWADITEACFNQDIDLRATYEFKDTDVQGYNIYGMAAAEIEVDILTGNYQLRRVDIIEDVGESMSPKVDVGQVEGAFIMAMGYWFSEELVYNTMNGELLTNRTWNYKPPGAKDIPVDFRITFLQKSPNPIAGVLRSKATGEPACCMAIVVLFALRNALTSSRIDAGLPDSWFTLGSGTTPEKAFLAAGNSIKKYTL